MVHFSSNSQQKLLKVTLFGTFTAAYQGLPLVDKDTRNSKVLQLFQYLLHHRDEFISQTQLIQVLLQTEDENSTSVLKNLVYRLRKLLAGVGIEKDCIVHAKRSYGLFADFPCDLDTEKFEALVIDLQLAAQRETVTLEHYLKALELYQGDFLAQSSCEPWVVAMAVHYRTLYFRTLKNAYRTALAEHNLHPLLPYLERAAAMYPYEDEVQILLILCLKELHQDKEALRRFETVTTLFYDDLGVEPGEQWRTLYHKITGGLQPTLHSAMEFRTAAAEPERKPGAFFCQSEVFLNIYRFTVRHMERSGKSVFLMLCTVTEEDTSTPSQGERLRNIISALRSAIHASCRSGDVYTRYTPTQFLLMLMEIDRNNCDLVAKRVQQNFNAAPRMSRLKLNFDYVSALSQQDLLL